MSVRDCQFHKIIEAHCAAQIEQKGAFECKGVLKDTKLQGFARAVRWNPLRSMLEEDYGISLIPLPVRFFHQKSKKHNPKGWTLKNKPGAFLATGNGKKTAGYASIDDRNLGLVEWWYKNRASVNSGSNRSMTALRDKAELVIARATQQQARLVGPTD